MNWEDDDYEDYVETDPDETFSVTCPNCGADVYEDCEMCPICHEYIIRSTNPLVGKPDWYIWTALLGILAVIFAMLFVI
ncbi:hypothetical protein [Thalassoglobus polymorphus]|uniref:Zinc-ribbon domain-containing protein n=1 Tax=Thalassoglobus polymorphus TaxID=2527994 RepID=A0A517QRR0_9PLAN|nr:hypothetical protein [Thalassoglobus polymorphus]QDT34316.1 hypothetical protein Mal48_35760 [Thalassoglobus polymorphus]